MAQPLQALALRARIILAADRGLSNQQFAAELARRVGISADSVHRNWTAFRLQSHRQETFKLSPDPQLIDEIRDIVGLYLAP